MKDGKGCVGGWRVGFVAARDNKLIKMRAQQYTYFGGGNDHIACLRDGKKCFN